VNLQRIFIVVPTYNGENDIPAFFDTLKKTILHHDVSIVVVDNASHDSTVSSIQSFFPKAIIIENTENRGYAGGCNQGMEYARSNGAEYIFLTNQDVRFSPGWLEPLCDMMKKHRNLAAVQSLILMDQDREQINSCGNELHFLGFGYTRGYREKQSDYRCGTTSSIGYCSGAAMLIRVDALRTVGLFDESYFMYHEDSDLCWRFRIAGYEIAVCSDSVVFHRYEFSRSIQKFYYIERNRLMNICKNYSTRSLILISPILFLWECGMILYSILGSLYTKKTITTKEKFRSYAYFGKISTWKHIKEERKKIKNIRRISDKELTKFFTSRIEFQDINNPLITYFANPITKVYWSLVRHLL